MKTKDLPKIAAGQLADSDCLLVDCAAQGTGLVPFAVLSDYHIKRTGVWPSNPNLLINADFRNPVNRNGQSEYTASGYTIDRWRIWSGVESVTLHNGYITLTALDNANGYYRQTLSENLLEYLFGKFVSLSFLFQNNEFTSITGTIPNGTIQFLQTLYSKGAIFMRNENGVLSVTISAQPANFTEIIAAKLELGPVQTLAHKEGDVWVLNDPPPVKSVELAKCQEYQFVVGGGNNRHIGTFEIGTSGNKIFTRIAVTLPTTQRKSTPAVKILGSGSLRLVQIANQIKAVGTISSTQQPESVFLSENCCYITYETPGLTAGMTGMVDTTNVSTFLCIDNNL